MAGYCHGFGGAAVEVRSVTVDARVLGEAVCEALAQGGSFVLTVTGNSMRPTLVPGRDQVCLVSARSVKPGDIVFFRRPTGEYILHRVLRKKEDRYTVNGDSQVWTEEIPCSAVIGVVSRIRRDGKWLDTDTLSMKTYSALWRATRPVRPALIQIKSKLKK